MKSKLLFLSILLAFTAFRVIAQPGCPSIDAGPDQTVGCTSPCTDLVATALATGATTSYAVTSIPYAPPAPYNVGTPVLVHTDDLWSSVLTLPFSFCFYDHRYTKVLIGSNEIISFDTASAGGYCNWSLASPTDAVPSVSLTADWNSVMGPYQDIDPTNSGSILWQLLGTYPCRMFIVSFYNVPYFGGTGSVSTGDCVPAAIYATSMIVLYESTNVIEIYIQNKPDCTGWNSGLGIEGIQNSTGTQAASVPGRNCTAFTVSNDAYRFTPNGTPNYYISWWQGGTQITPNDSISATDTLHVCPTDTTNYVAQIIYHCCAGNDVTVKDSVTVNVNNNMNLNITPLNPSICADSTITLTANFTNPLATIQWNTGPTTNSITVTPAATTTYTVTATAPGCTTTASTTVTILPNPTVNILASANPICIGNSTTLTAGGATTYLWSGGLGTANPITITPSGTGSTTYTVTGTTAGCTGTGDLVLTVNPLPTAQVVSHVDASCGLDVGTATALSGIGYSYLWSTSPAQTTITATGLAPGNYTVTVTNSFSCSSTANVTISATPAVTVTLVNVDSVLCNGQSTGSITVIGGGGTPPFTYSWNTTPVQHSATATNIPAGTYTVTVTDQEGCTNTLTATVYQPSLLNASITPTAALCFGQSNGSITVTPSGGVPNYTYLWNNSQTTPTISGLPIGTYTVTITDHNGCKHISSATVTQPTQLTLAINATPAICFGQSSGSITVTPTGGTPIYSYLWSNTHTTQTINSLAAGTYTVTVTDHNGCTSTSSAIVTQPTQLLVSISDVVPVLCNGQSTGSITVTAVDGVSPYSYYWSNSQTTAAITNLAVGTYTVTVTDYNGCTNTASAIITQPTQLNVSISNTVPATCFGLADGSITITVNGGVPNYTYQWSNSETTIAATNLPAGTYTVTVTDHNGCTNTASSIITQPSKVLISILSVDSVKCYGQASGSISVLASGGTPGYSYSWSNLQSGSIISNLLAGTYTVTATDNHGCKDSITTTVLQPTQLISTVTNADTILPCWGVNNGTITIAVVGGSRPWTFLWNTGATGMTINNLQGGIYTDTITDSKGCRNIHTVVVTQPTELFVQIDSIPVSCLYSCDGQLTSAVTGGTPWHSTGGLTYYHYHWNNGDTTESITGLCEGTYNLTITDSNGCQRIISNYLGVNDSVVANFSAAPTIGYIPLNVNFVYTGTSSPVNTYTWNFGDGNISSLENPTHIYTTADTFSVWLYIINGVCKDSIHLFVYPEIPSTLIVPNVFTPNGDGYNDEFMVKYQNIKTFSCMIFDRWGKKIYEWDDVTKGWDGKTNGGADCSDGTYFYIMTAEGVDGIKYNNHGTITLVR